MSHTGPAGAQQYSNEERAAIADEAHRAGLEGCCARARRRRHPRRHRSRHRLHRALLTRDARRRSSSWSSAARSSSRRPTSPTGWTSRTPRRSCRPRRPRYSPRPSTISRAIDSGVKGRVRHRRAGDPPWPQREGADRAGRPGHDAAAGDPAATTVAAELIEVNDRGRLEPGLLADIVAVPGDPLADIRRDRTGAVRDEGRRGLPPRRVTHPESDEQ